MNIPVHGEKLPQVVAYTDGSCLKNPGRGGYGVVLLFGERRKELHQGFRRTTNNRMEVMAAVVALESLTRQCAVTLHSDSSYLVNTISKGWAKRWQANGWRNGKDGKQSAQNVDLWKRLLPLCQQHKVEFKWIKGHAGHAENERADILAVMGSNMKESDMSPDTHYENGTTQAHQPGQSLFDNL